MRFSPSDAAFEGFRLVRRAPIILVLWSLFHVVASMVFFAAMGGSMANLLAVSAQLEQSEPSFQELSDLGRAFSGMMVMALPLMLAVSAVLTTAAIRGVLNPGQKAYGYIRFGADELRILAAIILTGLATSVVAFALYMIVGGLGFAAWSSGQAWLWLPTILGGMAAVCAIVWLSIRWSLALPLVFAEKRVAPFASFGLTKGRFWPLLGMGLLAVVMSILVSLLMSIATMPLTLLTGDINALAAYDGQATMAILMQAWPLLLGWSVINAVSTVLQMAVMYAPFSAAYIAIRSENLQA